MSETVDLFSVLVYNAVINSKGAVGCMNDLRCLFRFIIIFYQEWGVFMLNVPEMFGSAVFNDEAMKKYLPKNTYKDLKQTIEDGKPLDINIANVVAHAMKEWYDRDHRRKARQLHLTHIGRKGHHGILGQGAYQGRT